jgi:hypothetical protein
MTGGTKKQRDKGAWTGWKRENRGMRRGDSLVVHEPGRPLVPLRENVPGRPGFILIGTSTPLSRGWRPTRAPAWLLEPSSVTVPSWTSQWTWRALGRGSSAGARTSLRRGGAELTGQLEKRSFKWQKRGSGRAECRCGVFGRCRLMFELPKSYLYIYGRTHLSCMKKRDDFRRRDPGQRIPPQSMRSSLGMQNVEHAKVPGELSLSSVGVRGASLGPRRCGGPLSPGGGSRRQAQDLATGGRCGVPSPPNRASWIAREVPSGLKLTPWPILGDWTPRCRPRAGRVSNRSRFAGKGGDRRLRSQQMQGTRRHGIDG